VAEKGAWKHLLILSAVIWETLGAAEKKIMSGCLNFSSNVNFGKRQTNFSMGQDHG
jgi:hypothetical protein